MKRNSYRSKIFLAGFFHEKHNTIFSKDKPPKEYFEDLQRIYSEKSLKEMLNSHAIPENFFEMDYQTFLNERRKLMAKEIEKYFKTFRRDYIFM